MPPVSDTAAMIAGMAPVLQRGTFHFCTAKDRGRVARAMPHALATFHESEGVSLILPGPEARDLGFPTTAPMACITLTVQSSLEGVGLTAAVATTLAEAGIPCNMVAAYHHDHAFVPLARAEEALERLKALAIAWGQGGGGQ
jgi:hypothetical protein